MQSITQYHSSLQGFPQCAVQAGADLVVQSPHKTLGSFPQSSVLHLRSSLVDQAKVHAMLGALSP